jgi:hypothetical protein
MYRPRVLLAEDHAETAERRRKLLRADFDVIASVEDGDTPPRSERPDCVRDSACRVDVRRGRSEAGALGYVLKDSAGDNLVAAIQAALSGRQYVSRELGGFERL